MKSSSWVIFFVSFQALSFSCLCFHGIIAMEVSFDTSFASNLSITQCVTLKLNDSNYPLMKTQFECFHYSHMLLCFVTDFIPWPSSTISVKTGNILAEKANYDFIKWVHNDQLVMLGSFNLFSKMHYELSTGFSRLRNFGTLLVNIIIVLLLHKSLIYVVTCKIFIRMINI